MRDGNHPILVVGATGSHGGTGLTVAEVLRKRGREVRALARSEGPRTDVLRALGAKIAIGDLHDRKSLLAALDGVEVAYFAYPVAGGIVDAATNFASAGRATGLRRVVVMSMATSNPDSPSHLGRAQWLAEEVLGWAGFSCLFLRFVAFFFENISLLHSADILSDGVLQNSFADRSLPWIAGEDAGKVAVAALLHPERFGDTAAVYPTGGYQYRYSEIAALLARHLDRSITHKTVPQELWTARLAALGENDRRINPDMARHISALGAAFRGTPPPLNKMVEEVTHERPSSLEQALESGRLIFEARAL
jgi:uncharacterized protein YbjT (DUF2867 family)